ncbi:hypothetical protein PFISCL1PPCAC_8974, partial [Pristionchus fissidentatus]
FFHRTHHGINAERCVRPGVARRISFLGATSPATEEATSSGAEEDSFEIVDAASADDEAENDGKVTVDNQTNEEGSEDKMEGGEAEETAPASAADSRDAATASSTVSAEAISTAASATANAATQTEKDEAVVENGSKIPSPRLIRVELRSDESECGMEVYRMDRNGFGVGAIIKNSAADRAGLVPGDRICFINTVSIETMSEPEVLDLLGCASAEKTFEVLTLLGDELELYKELGLHVSPHLPNIIRRAAASEAPRALQLGKPEDRWNGC